MMKVQLLAVIALFCLSCSNDKKTTEASMQASKLKTNILLESTLSKPFSGSNTPVDHTITVIGSSILKGTAVVKVIDTHGEELYCESFSARNLIQPDYKTANSVLQRQHVIEVVEGYFLDSLDTEKYLAASH